MTVYYYVMQLVLLSPLLFNIDTLFSDANFYLPGMGACHMLFFR